MAVDSDSPWYSLFAAIVCVVCGTGFNVDVGLKLELLAKLLGIGQEEPAGAVPIVIPLACPKPAD
jgi:hypothetical protein